MTTTKTEHDCREHLYYVEHEWVETHGLECGPFEHWREAWWQCSVCGEKFTAEELDRMKEAS